LPSAPVPAPAASSPQLEPSRNRGPSPEPQSESLPPLGSVTAPCPVQRKHRHRREGKRDDGCLFSHTLNESGERVCSEPRCPLRSPCPSDTSAVRPGPAPVGPAENSWSVGSWNDALLGSGCQK